MSIFRIEKLAELNEDVFKDVLFFQIAEWGAMGEPGGVCVINRKKDIFFINTIHSDIGVEKIEELFPPIKQCSFGLFGYDSVVPKGWNYVNQGFGNHLLVADEVYGEFCELTKDCKSVVDYYANWFDAAKMIVGISEGVQ